ncbi:uncharacterized protein MYCFIDRAFT_31866 [Pseudocercospora fijiensis CIRAD86]|uniref:RRM domain-containing protein n=1 Tax=Pseudocercospora fijiensis (strain CIRAD86) TaxID=383855 RepID=M3A6Y6_PSEFD|nr:uncharacterized protein MYCFIDRAFT_31866 [Pseudocercospora fijiensis CIRAD86]EME80376.1 hypothetical protein MYCFIDRAFT_31866 [Pseudocercospora fijiensis CIRAD86]
MASAGTVPGSNAVAQKVTPNQSLYIQNLPEKLQKADLKRNLYMLLSTYGPVLDITALKTPKMRGQAHVLFRDVNSATQAMRHCQGYEFFGREMKISYAKSRSNTLAKLTGTFHEEQASKAAAPNASTTNSIAPPSSFPAPPGSTNAPPSGLPPPPAGAENAPSPASTAGQKRQREESDDEGGDAPMDEDSGGEMEMSDSD